MAEGDHSDDEVPAGDNQFNDMDDIHVMEFEPQYVINASIIVEGWPINPPPIRIPRRYTVVDVQFVLNLVRRALVYISQQPLTRHCPLFSMMDWHADYCSVRLDASGESLQVGFYPVYTDTPPETSVSESSTDDEEPGPSNPLNSSKASAGGSRTSADQSSGSQVKKRQGVKRQREHGRSESRKRKRRRSNSPESRWETHMSRSSTDDKEPGPSNPLNSSKARAGGSRTSADQLSDSQVEIRQGVKRKRKTSGRSESRGRKSKRLDHHSGSESSDEQPGPSHRENSEARASADQISQDESRQGVKRKRKRSELLETQSKKRKSDHQSDSSINSLVSESSRMYVSTPPAACGKTKSSNRDDEQDELPQLVNNSVVRTEGSRAPSEQGSGSQVDVRRCVKRKRKTSGSSESRESKRKRLDHRSDADSNDDQPDPTE